MARRSAIAASHEGGLRVAATRHALTSVPTDGARAELADIALLARDGALAALGSSAQGIAWTDAEARLARYGANVVAADTRKHPLRRWLELTFSPLSVLLFGIAAVNFATGEIDAAIIVLLMVVLSSLLSFVQEHRANAAARKLQAMVSVMATVARTGSVPAASKRGVEPGAHAGVYEIPIARVVPGDVVHLCAGDVVPGDVRILEAKDLFVNQAALTGESLPVEKFPAAATDAALPVLERKNLAFLGTHVTSGTATAIVVATGASTCFGGVARQIVQPQAVTSFDRGLARYTWLIIRFMAVMLPLVFLVNGLTKHDWLEALLFAVAVAVGLAPEMLPMIVTINLAKGALAMSRKHVIVKRLGAIQNFGAMDVLCTDKTGTLTQDRVILERHVDAQGRDSARVLEYAYLNSYHQTGLRNLLDVAVLRHVDVHERLQASAWTKVDEIPFDFQRRRMSVVVAKPGAGRVLVCKGAVEEVLAACDRVVQDGREAPLDASHAPAVAKLVEAYNEEGFRVIAIAYRTLDGDRAAYSVADETGLVLAGFCAFLDPPKEGAGRAVHALAHYGVAVKVLTGDNEAVARSVCRHVGVPAEHVLRGSEVEAMGDAELGERLEACTILAKLSPAQKARVITVLQQRGHVVGFLGDGINDGPALEAADIGISVDTAVDVAKETADIVLLEKSLDALRQGIVEGRKVFANITKYLRMGSSSNFGNMLSVVGASAFLPFLPMAPVQILLTNLLYDLSQTTVATDRVDSEELRHPRQWHIRDIGRFMLAMGPVSSLFDYLAFATLLLLFNAWDDPTLFHTGWFVESVLTQTLVVHVIRTSKVPFVQSRPSLPLLVTTTGVCLLALWLPVSPVASALGFAPLPAGYVLAVLGIVVAYLGCAQVVKGWLVHRFRWV